MDEIGPALMKKSPRLDLDTPFCRALAPAENAVEDYWDKQEFPASESDEEYEYLDLPALVHNDRDTLQSLRSEINRFNLYARMLGTNCESTRPYVRAAKALRTKHEIDKLYDCCLQRSANLNSTFHSLDCALKQILVNTGTETLMIGPFTEYDVKDLRDTFNGPPGGHEAMHVDDPEDYERYLRESLPKAARKSPTPNESQNRAFFHKVNVLIRKIKGNVEYNGPIHYDRRMHLWVFAIARVFPPSNLRCVRLTHDHPECAFREVRLLLSRCRITNANGFLEWWDIAAAFRDLNVGGFETIRGLDYVQRGWSDYWTKAYDLLRRLRDLAEEEIRFTVDLALSNEQMPRLPPELKEQIFGATMLAEEVPLDSQL